MFLNSKPTISNGEKILEECMQGGTYATKYSNVFDLKNGDIFLYRFQVWDKGIRLNLFDELKKGEHYYDIPEIQKQIEMKPKPLKVSMIRFPLHNYTPAPNQEVIPENILKKIFNDMAEGKMDKNDYTPEFWPHYGNIQEAVKDEVRGYGKMISATLLEREDRNNKRKYKYLVVFKNTRMIECMTLNNKNKVAWFKAEDFE